MIYNHKKFEQLKNEYEENKVYYRPIFRREMENKLLEMTRICVWLLTKPSD